MTKLSYKIFDSLEWDAILDAQYLFRLKQNCLLFFLHQLDAAGGATNDPSKDFFSNFPQPLSSFHFFDRD